MKNLVFIAMHGTGKGTQCNLLKKNCGFIHISTGELFRQRIKQGDQLGTDIAKTINNGHLVSNEVVLTLLEEFIVSNKLNSGIIFDGYPRNTVQAQQLDNLMQKLNTQIDLAIYLEIPKEEALKRTLGRLICPKCNKTYNMYYNETKPHNKNLCDNCNIELEKRTDDTQQAFNSLYDVFIKETKPILKYYEEKGVLKVIDAGQTPNNIFEQIKKCLND